MKDAIFDLIGLLFLFATAYGFLVIGWALQ